MKKSSDLESILEEPEDHFEDRAEKINIKVFERRNTIKNLKTDENSSSEEEMPKPLENLNKHPVLNLEKVVEAFESVAQGLQAPPISPSLSESSKTPDPESSDFELSAEIEIEPNFKLSLLPASNVEEDLLQKWTRNFYSVNKSPSKKEEEQILKEILQELERLSSLQASEELNL
jgi:hypothetical protein